MLDKIPYSPGELTVTGQYPRRSGRPGAPRYARPVSPKENFLAAIRDKAPLWYPTTRDYELFMTRIVPDNIARAMWNDNPDGSPEPQPGGPDMFGIEWVYVPSVGGSMVKPGSPLMSDANDWKELVKLPDVDSWDWAGVAARNPQLHGDDRLMGMIQFTGFFERLISFMDFEDAAVALIDDSQQDAVHELFAALTGVYKKILTNAKKYFGLGMVLFHDDWGSQRAPFFSADTCREMVAPYLKEMVDFCHANDIVFELHSCGMVEPMVPVMIECGVDMWAGQPMNDFEKLYGLYGDKIMLGIRVQDRFLDNSVPEEEMRASISHLLDVFGKPGKPVYYAISYSARDDSRYMELLYEMGRKHLLSQN